MKWVRKLPPVSRAEMFTEKLRAQELTRTNDQLQMELTAAKNSIEELTGSVARLTKKVGVEFLKLSQVSSGVGEA